MKIGVLTSSRADFGIYSPLLKQLANNPAFQLEIIAFGTHNSEKHGNTINEIRDKNFGLIHALNTMVDDSDAYGTAKSYAHTIGVFTEFWNTHTFDLVLCLGDRYEMSAAVQAAIPLNVRFAHFHGGETTLGAIDNIYRHQISIASTYHFTSTAAYKDRVLQFPDINKNHVFNVGSLSLSGLESLPTIDKKLLLAKFEIPVKPYILSTFHPETVNPDRNKTYCDEMIESFKSIPDSHHLIVTMPNADTNGILFRNALKDYQKSNPDRISLVESFGKDYYFAAMKHAEFILGNSSSAIIEAASFGQYVINVGERQKGRIQSDNTFNCEFKSTDINILISKLINMNHKYTGENVYVKSNTVEMVISELSKIADGRL